MATYDPQLNKLGQIISIHATLAGGDGDWLDTWDSGDISIHATLAGGDGQYHDGQRVQPRFLSTPPSRVATLYF